MKRDAENNGNNKETLYLPVVSANIVAVSRMRKKKIRQDMAKLASYPISLHLAPCTKYFVAAATVAHSQR